MSDEAEIEVPPGQQVIFCRSQLARMYVCEGLTRAACAVPQRYGSLVRNPAVSSSGANAIVPLLAKNTVRLKKGDDMVEL